MRVLLQSGRKLMVQQLLFRQSMLGISEGRPDLIRLHVVATAKKEAERLFGTHAGFLLIEPPAERLPSYQFFVDLRCYTPLRPGAGYSALVCCWFDDAVTATLTEYLAAKIQSIDWDLHAKDGSY